MSWYRPGTVAVTNGSKNVTGTGTLWASSVNAGDAFALVDANLNPTGAWYEVETVTSNTAIVLKQSYAGATGSNKTYCVFNLVGNMTTPSFAQRLAQFFDQFQDLVDLPTTTPTASSIPIAGSGGTLAAGWLPDATTAAKGAVELATSAETQTGTDVVRAVTPAGALALLTSRALGATSSPPEYPHNDLNTITNISNGGWYRYVSSLQANSPTTTGTGVVCSIRHVAAITQIASSAGTTKNTLHTRYYTSTTWSAWVQLQDNENVAVTSTDDATSATAAPLKSAGGLAVAKKAWLDTLVLGLGGVEIRSRSVDNDAGAVILAPLFSDTKPVTGFLFVTELETSNYLIATFFKRSQSDVHTCTVLASNGLSLGGSNVSGTQLINGATNSNNVRMRSILIRGD